jgi:putative ABC transport system ATP-binding protein
VPIHNLKNSQLAAWRGSNIGIVFQFFQLMPTLTVLENVMLPMEFANRVARGEQKQRAMDLLKRVNIADMAHKFPTSMSGGEKQRVAIARALANNPNFIIADEPTGNLDSVNTNTIHQLFNSLADEGKTIVYVTHEKDTALRYTRRIEMVDGKISNK